MFYTFHQLQIFISVCNHNSITKASEELNLTQPAVSIQLKKFQDQFDIPLTEVIGRQLHVTGFGKEIELVARKVLASSEELKFVHDRYNGLLTGEVKISIVSTGKYVMPYFLRDFAKKNPGVKISIDVTNKERVLRALTENNTDFGLISVLPDDLKTENVELLENSLYLVKSNLYGDELKDYPTLEELNKLTFIFREEGSATRDAMMQFLESQNIVPKRTMTLASNEAVKQAVQAGLGYSVMPIIGLKEEIESNTIEIIKVKGLPVKTKWNLVHAMGKKFTPASKALKKYIELNKESVINGRFSWINEL